MGVRALLDPRGQPLGPRGQPLGHPRYLPVSQIAINDSSKCLLGALWRSPTSREGLFYGFWTHLTQHGALRGRGVHAIRTRIMVFGEVSAIFVEVTSESAPGTHVGFVGAISDAHW